MDLVLDTCIVRRHEKGMSKVPKFNYSYVDSLINDSSNVLFVTEFTCLELYVQKGFTSQTELFSFLKKKNLKLLRYNAQIDENDFDFINRAGAIMIKDLTGFLEFFVLNLALQNINGIDVKEIVKIVNEETEKFYSSYGEINLSNCSRFMKNDSVDYLIKTTIEVFYRIGIVYNEHDIWKLISNTDIANHFINDNVDKNYLWYASYIRTLFKDKIKNKASKISFNFGFIDLLICHANEFNYLIISSDKDLCKFLLKHGNNANKAMIKNLWASI